MVRFVTVVLIVTLVANVCAAAATGQREDTSYSVNASGGSLGLAHVSGGKFDAGSFSIGHAGQSSGSGHGGHGGNYGTNSYGGPGGDSGHSRYS